MFYPLDPPTSPFRTALAAGSAVLLALCLSSVTAAEDTPTVPASQDEAPATDALLASDGQPAAPGRVPSDTEESAAERWTRMVDVVTVPRSADGPAAFELALSIRHKDETGSRDFNGRFGYLESGEGLVRMELLDEKNRVVSVEMRGPDPKRPGRLAYWFRKDRGSATTEGWIERGRGADTQAARDEMDRFASVSYDIARLLDPRSMRIVALRSLGRDAAYDPAKGWLRLGDDRGVQLPNVDVYGKQNGREKRVAQLAAELEWLELVTPDFRLFETDLKRSEREFLRRTPKRVVLGIDPKSNRPQLVLVAGQASGPLQTPGTVLLQCTDWFPAEAPVLPGNFYAYETVARPDSVTGMAFGDITIADLYLLDGYSLDPKFTPAHFAPE